MKILKNIGYGFFRSANIHTPENGPSIWKRVVMVGPFKLILLPMLAMYLIWSLCFFVLEKDAFKEQIVLSIFSMLGCSILGCGALLLMAEGVGRWNTWAKKEREKWNS